VCETVRAAYARYDFRTVHNSVYDFCNPTLSAVYLAAVKDRLYCDRPASPRRRRTQGALWLMTDGLCRLLATVLCHTADEAYRALWKADQPNALGEGRCVHLQDLPTPPDVAVDAAWNVVMALRPQVQGAIEAAKAETGVENPLDAGVILPDPDGLLERFDPADLADLVGVSRAMLDQGLTAPRVVDLRAEPRCERSWKRDGTVKRRVDGGMLSDRDAEALGLA
jgi:isoleucyl-tRNA synthetase